jgi:hypothetical protein
MPERSGAGSLVTQFTRRVPMSLVATVRPIPAPATRDHAADRPDRDRQPSRLAALLEALAYAGASIDPTAALAARRFARIRDEELRRGRW